jgi:hypothetical protein
MTANGKTQLPAAPFKTFLRLVAYLNDQGLPSHLGVANLTSFPARTASQLIAGLKWLGLVSPRNESTVALQEMVEAFGTAAFHEKIKLLLKDRYGIEQTHITLPLSKVADILRLRVPDASDEVISRAALFYAHAHRYALLTPPTQQLPTMDILSQLERATDQGRERAVLFLVMTKYPAFDPHWPNDIKLKWFAGFDRLMRSTDRLERRIAASDSG